MDSLPRPLDAEALLAECGWVRALARRLLGDDELAEEIVQETCVAALERRPALGNGPRAWLGAVARNLALRARRRALQRGSVERRAARPEATRGGQEEVERMQLQRLLAGAVLALEEPQRSAVILRHLDGLSAREIARRQGCSADAARQRVARGLAELRMRLDRRFGERSAWAALLARASTIDPGAAGPALIGLGGIGMGTKTVLALAAGAAACVLAAATLLPERAESETARVAEDVEARLASAPTPAQVEDRARPAPAAPQEVAPDRRTLPAAAGNASPAALQGSVMDRAGRPLAGAEARLAHAIESDPERALARAESDASGRFALRWPAAAPEPAEPLWLAVECNGFASERRALSGPEPVTIVLARLPRIAGRILGPDGPAAPPARVNAEIETLAGTHESRGIDTIDADGRFELADLPLGVLISVCARAKGFAPAALEPELELGAEAVHSLDIVLSRGATVRGSVLDAITRVPVPDAEVWAEVWDFEPDSVNPTTRTDALGRFQLEGVVTDTREAAPGERALALVHLLARAEGYAPAHTRAYVATRNEAEVYEFEVLLDPASSSFAGRVLAPGTREPVPCVLINAIDAGGNLHFAESDRQGRFVLEGLLAGRFALIARSGGGLGATSLQRELELEPGEHRVEDLELLASETTLEVRLVDAAGAGVSAAVVECQAFFEANNIRMTLEGSTLTSDANGVARVEGLAAGEYELRPCLGDPCAEPPLQRIVLERGQTARLPDFRVGPCHAVEGWVDRGAYASDALEICVRRPASRDCIASAVPESDGSFRIEGLLAGTHELVLRAGEMELDRTLFDPAGARGLVLNARER